MNSSEFPVAIQSAQPALELISLARLSADAARKNLRSLLLANPSYFGRITGDSFKAVLGIQEDTTYECLSCVGYNPQLEILEAIITVSQGLGHSNHSGGSVEYVRFYLSFDGGFSWRDQGLHSVRVFDVPGRSAQDHVVQAGIAPARTLCFLQTLPRVRAILSWNAAPPGDAPDWTPVWGNVLEVQLQIDELSATPLETLIAPDLMTMPINGAVA